MTHRKTRNVMFSKIDSLLATLDKKERREISNFLNFDSIESKLLILN